MSPERYKGRSHARALSSSEVAMAADALVLGEFDWRDWWTDKPSKDYMRGWSDEVMVRDETGC